MWTLWMWIGVVVGIGNRVKVVVVSVFVWWQMTHSLNWESVDVVVEIEPFVSGEGIVTASGSSWTWPASTALVLLEVVEDVVAVVGTQTSGALAVCRCSTFAR